MTTEHLHSPSSSSNSPNAFSSRSTGAPPALMSGVVPPFMGGGGGGASAQVNLPKPNEEVWVENKTSDNRVYYYNARTRESSWTKPAGGPNVRVITQDEVERMAAVNNQLQQATGNSTTASKQAGAAATGDQNASKSTNNEAADANDASKDQHLNGNKPAAQAVQSSSESKVNDAKPTNPVPGVPPGPVAPMIPPPFAFQGGPMPPFPFMPGAPGAPPVGAPPAGFPPFMPPPGMFPPGGFPGPFPGMPPPPFGAPFGMPPFGVPPFAVPPFAAHPLDEGKYYYTEETKREMKEVEEKMVKAREESAYYTEHDTPDGKKYYFNSKLNQSVWEKPKCLTELTELEARFEELKKKRIEKPIEQASSGKGQSAKDAKDKENELSEEEKAKQKSKPVSSTAVPGTPWCVVWTRDRRVFFYNPSEKVSLWERPPILMGRPDVDKLVKECPVKDTGDSQTTVSSTPSAAAAAAAAVSAGKKKSGETTAAEPPVKKNKVSVDDDENSRGSASPKSDAANSPRGDRSMSPFSTPTKPQVVPDEFLQKDKIEASKEAALEAEHKAAQVRAQLPLEQRIQQFKDLLVEKDVSAYSTWEKELQKIVFDPRYLLLTSKERKSVFEKYVRDRANQESKEKSAALKKKKDDFRELLKEANVSTKNSMSFTEFSAKYGRDERFKAIDKLKDRELMFNDYLSDLRRQEKEEKQQSDKEARKKNFYSMLKELKHLYKHSSWTETKKLIENDARYKAIESSSKREDYFRDYCKGLDDKPSATHNGDSSKSRDKHEKSSDKHDKHKSSDDREKRRSSKEREKDKDRERDKERDKDKDKEKEKDKDRERERDRDRDRERDKDKEKDRDREREREKDRDKERDKDKDKENKKDAESSRMDHDGEPVEKEKKKRHKTTTASQESNNGREEGETNDDDDDDEEMPEHDDHKNNHQNNNDDDDDQDHDNTHNGLSDEEKRKEREKQERIEASLRERNKEVKEQLSKYQDERDKGREKLKKDEIVECFRALLIDLIKTNVSTGGGDSSSSSSSKPSELSWKEAKKILKRDSRWSYCKPLEKDEKESLFDEHIKKFRAKKRDLFYQLLDESSSSINLKTSTWKEVKKLIKSDPRYEKLQTGGDSFKMEKEFDTYLAERLAKAKLDFKELLMQTKLITHNTFTKLKEQPNHAKELEDLLANDKSYLVLDCVPDERKKILLDYVEQLHKDGPPPPPTATEPSKIRNKT